MCAKKVKEKIIDAAWDLFYKNGFEETTLNDIIEEADISKGTFYYYFRSKDTLLNTLSTVLDEQYEELDRNMPADMDAFEKLMYLNGEVHTFIGEKIDHKLLANLYSAQLIKEDESNLLNRDRYYFQLLFRIIEEGQKRNELVRDKTASELVRVYGICERSLVTDWCMNNGSYSLGDYSREYMPLLFGAFRAKEYVERT